MRWRMPRSTTVARAPCSQSSPRSRAAVPRTPAVPAHEHGFPRRRWPHRSRAARGRRAARAQRRRADGAGPRPRRSRRAPDAVAAGLRRDRRSEAAIPGSGRSCKGGDEDIIARVGTLCRGGRRGGLRAHRARSLRRFARSSGSRPRARCNAGSVPAMRKDFLVDPYQVAEARLAGAGGILVIVRMLDARRARCADRGGAAARPVRADRDLRRGGHRRGAATCSPRTAAARCASCCIGVNSRDLVTLKVVPGRLEELVAGAARRACRAWPRAGSPRADDAARLAARGYDMALIGSALMTAGDPAGLLRAMIAAGRGARAR